MHLSNPLHRYMDFVRENLRHLIEEKKIPIEHIRFNETDELHLLGDEQISVFANPKYTLEQSGYVSGLQTWKMKSLDAFMKDGRKAVWHFNANLEIWGDAPDAAHQSTDGYFIGDITAYLPGIKDEYCEVRPKNRLQSDQESLYMSQMKNSGNFDYTFPQAPPPTLDIEARPSEGCFLSFDGKERVYYQTLYTNQNFMEK